MSERAEEGPVRYEGPLVVAIDGPSGSGKSSVSRAVAQRLRLAFLDTGAMYRALTWYCMHTGIDLDAAGSGSDTDDTDTATDTDDAGTDDAVVEAARDIALAIILDNDHEFVAVDGEDITQAIREPEVSSKVSAVATNRAAREVLVNRQRELIEQTGRRIVAEGRDITTVVAPDAQVRILLTASPEARMRRRGLQLGGTQSESQLQQQVVDRDTKDSTVVDFMSASDGVTTIDSSDLDFEQTVQSVLDVVDRAMSPARQ